MPGGKKKSRRGGLKWTCRTPAMGGLSRMRYDWEFRHLRKTTTFDGVRVIRTSPAYGWGVVDKPAYTPECRGDAVIGAAVAVWGVSWEDPYRATIPERNTGQHTGLKCASNRPPPGP